MTCLTYSIEKKAWAPCKCSMLPFDADPFDQSNQPNSFDQSNPLDPLDPSDQSNQACLTHFACLTQLTYLTHLTVPSCQTHLICERFNHSDLSYLICLACITCQCDIQLAVPWLHTAGRRIVCLEICLTKLHVISYRVERDGDEGFLPPENFTFDVRVDTDSRQVWRITRWQI